MRYLFGLFGYDRMTPSMVRDVVCLNRSPWDDLFIVFSPLEKRLNLRQRKCERLRPWEPGEEQHIFLCTSKWWWGAEITYVSPGFPTSEIWNFRLRGRFNFFRALKCWAKFFFMKLRINLMTAQVPALAVNTRNELILYWVIFSRTSEAGEWGRVHM